MNCSCGTGRESGDAGCAHALVVHSASNTRTTKSARVHPTVFISKVTRKVSPLCMQYAWAEGIFLAGARMLRPREGISSS